MLLLFTKRHVLERMYGFVLVNKYNFSVIFVYISLSAIERIVGKLRQRQVIYGVSLGHPEWGLQGKGRGNPNPPPLQNAQSPSTDINKYNKSAKDSTSGFLMRKIANVCCFVRWAAKIMLNGRN